MDGPRAYTTIQRLEETDTGKGDNGLWNEQRDATRREGSRDGEMKGNEKPKERNEKQKEEIELPEEIQLCL